MLHEQRQIIFHAARGYPFADILIERVVCRQPFELRPIAAAELFDRLLIKGKFACGEEVDGIHLLFGSLGFRVESADGFDVFVEQLNAVRRVATHGEQIENGPAYGELAMPHDLGNALVAHAFQPSSGCVHPQYPAHFNHHAVGQDMGARRQLLHQCGGCRHQHATADFWQPCQGLDPLGDDFRQRRKHIVRQGFPVREL